MHLLRRPEGAAARPPRRRAAARDGRRAGRARRLRRPARRPTSRTLGAWFVEAADSGSLERYLETFAHTVGVMQTREALVRVAAECAQDLAADGVVYAEVRFAPELHVDRGPGARRGRRGGARRVPRGRAARPRRPVRRSGSARCSPRCGTPPARWRSPSWRCATATGRGRLRHRRRRGRLPAHPAPGRLRVPPAGERPLHHPRRRGVRAAVDLAGDPVVRRRPARPRRADHRRHHRRRRRRGHARPARGVRARQAHPAGDVPVVERADRRGRLDRRAPDRAAAPAAASG